MVCRECGREAARLTVGLCRACAGIGKNCYWSKEKIVVAIQRWKDEFGSIPTSMMWMRGGEWWPSRSAVVKHFGTWSDGIKAAGFMPRTKSMGTINYHDVRRGWERVRSAEAEKRGPRSWGRK